MNTESPQGENTETTRAESPTQGDHTHERIVCPWSNLVSDKCPTVEVDVYNPITRSHEHSQEETNAHITWHVFEEVRMGTLVENENGTFALPRDTNIMLLDNVGCALCVAEEARGDRKANEICGAHVPVEDSDNPDSADNPNFKWPRCPDHGTEMDWIETL